MEYVDPLPVTCPSCNKMGAYSVAELLALTARCAFCSHTLASVGREMRSAYAENSAFFSMVEVALVIERELGIEVSDALLETCPTPRDLALKLAESSAKTSAQDIESVVRQTLAHVSERDVAIEDLTEPWKSFLPES